MSRRKRIVLWVLGGFAALVAVVLFVFFGPPNIARSFAEPGFCAECHEMEPWLAGFRESPHGGLESCNECHLPHDNVAQYYVWEAIVGTRDITKHTFGAIPETIEARERTRRWAKENCRRCHGEQIDAGHGTERAYCWASGCHDYVIHEVEQ